MREKEEEEWRWFSYTHQRVFFQIVTADSFTVRLDWFLDSSFYTNDTSNCLVGLSKRYLKKEISALHFSLFILGFHLLVSIALVWTIRDLYPYIEGEFFMLNKLHLLCAFDFSFCALYFIITPERLKGFISNLVLISFSSLMNFNCEHI